MTERTLRVGRTMIDVYVGRHLHLLDRDQEGTMTLTNAIDSDYLKNVLGWLGDIPFEKVYLYHTDGFITEYDPVKGFKHVSQNSIDLYFRFLEVCQKRKEQFQYVH